MSYCVNCGVELEKGEAECPLCHTTVHNPNEINEDKKGIYSPYKTVSVQKVSRKSIIELISWIFAIPLLLSIVCNMSINGSITWSGYVIGALALLYVTSVVPFIITRFTKRGAPAICIFFDFLCVVCFLLYIEGSTGGKWFFGFALPLLIIIFVFLITVLLLHSLAKASPLTISAIVLVFCGILCMATEFLINICFNVRTYLIWSFYPMITSIILAVILFIIDRNPAIKEKMKKKFFI